MKVRCKFAIISLIMIVTVLFAPVNFVYAADGSFNENVPYLQGLEFNMHVNSTSGRGAVLDTILKNKEVDSFIFQFDKLENIDYENYDVVFDMVLKSKVEDGSITTHEHTEKFDIVTSGKPGWFNGLLMSIGLKDSYYKISMDFETLVKNSPDCIGYERWVSDGVTGSAKKIYEYNTVITQVDCYLREKSTGNHGLISRFYLSWDSEFRNALCTNVTYNLIAPDSNEILDSGSNLNSTGAYGYNSDGDNIKYQAKNVLASIISFFTDIPSAIVVLVTGFTGLITNLSDLITVVFPFIPSGIISVLLLMLLLFLIIAIYKLIQGWIG